MKKLFLAAMVALASTATFAQDDMDDKKVNFSVGVELAAPVGDLKQTQNFGIGGTAQVEYKLAPNFGLTGNAGYITYSGKTYNFGGFTAKSSALGQIPILAGVRYYFIPGIYVSGQLGASIFSSSGSSSSSAFTYAPGVGIKVSLIDMTLKYLAATKNGSTLSNVGLRVAFTF